jgi:hypothetical protein
MENKPNVWKNGLNWGIITGLLTVIYLTLMYFLGLNLERWTGWISYVIIIGGIVYGTIQYRDNVRGGTISYAQALGFGVIIALVVAVIAAVYSLVLSLIDPGIIDQILEKAQDEMLKQGLSEDQVEQAVEIQRKFMSPGIIAAMTVPSYTFMGFLFSLITSIFLKKEDTSVNLDTEE